MKKNNSYFLFISFSFTKVIKKYSVIFIPLCIIPFLHESKPES